MSTQKPRTAMAEKSPTNRRCDDELIILWRSVNCSCDMLVFKQRAHQLYQVRRSKGGFSTRKCYLMGPEVSRWTGMDVSTYLLEETELRYMR